MEGGGDKLGHFQKWWGHVPIVPSINVCTSNLVETLLQHLKPECMTELYEHMCVCESIKIPLMKNSP